VSRRLPDFDRTPLRPDRVRKIDGSFAFLPHRFLRDGFWASLDHRELLLYVLLALVADRHGMSFYFDDRLAAMLRISLDELLAARAGLLRKSLLAYEPAGPRYQLLALPSRPTIAPPHTPRPGPTPPRADPTPPRADPTHVRNLIRDWLAAQADDDRDR
jgi:hypothetical protein